MSKRKNKNYSGLTLIEMLMAIMIFAIGIFGFSLLFSRTWKVNSYTLEMGQASIKASHGLDQVADYIRRARQGDNGAYPIVSANDNDLVFYCDYDKDGSITERLHIYRSGSEILMGITEPTQTLPKTYPSGDEETKVLVTDFVNADDVPLFSYFNENYPSDTDNNPMATPSAVEDVRLVKVYLNINTKPNQSEDNVELQSFVEMRNLNDYNQTE